MWESISKLFKELSAFERFLMLCVFALATTMYHFWSHTENKFTQLEGQVIECHKNQIDLLTEVVKQNTAVLEKVHEKEKI